MDLSHRARCDRARHNNPPYYFGQMFAVEAEHDTSAKTIFNNVAVPAGQTAEQDLGHRCSTP